VFLSVSSVVSAQKRTPFDGRMEYQLTVEKQSAPAVAGWWPTFVSDNTLEGYCWNLNTLPLADRRRSATRRRFSASAAPGS
jgi:hypothetical protein